MLVEIRKDENFLKPFIEIDGFLYGISDTPGELCVARLMETRGISSNWHLFSGC